MDKNSSLVAAIIGVVGIIIGAIVGFSFRTKPAINTTTSDVIANVRQAADLKTDTAAATLRTNMVVHHQQYTDATLTTARALADQRSDAAQAATWGDTITRTLAADVTRTYSSGAADQLYQIWSSYTRFLMDYTAAVRENNTDSRDAQVTNMNGFVESLTSYTHAIVPKLGVTTFRSSLQQYVASMKQSVDKYQTKDFTGAYAAQQKAGSQITALADTLSAAIVQEHPERF